MGQPSHNGARARPGAGPDAGPRAGARTELAARGSAAPARGRLEFLSDTLEREYGDLFIETEEQDDTESVTTLDTAATVNLRKVSNNELLHISRRLDELVSNRNELRKSADAKSLVAEQELYKAQTQEELAEQAWQKHIDLEYQADNMRDGNGNKLGRGALSVDQLKALKSAKEDAHRQRVLATRQREHATEEHQLALKEEHLRQNAERAAPPSPRLVRRSARRRGEETVENQKERWRWKSKARKCHQGHNSEGSSLAGGRERKGPAGDSR